MSETKIEQESPNGIQNDISPELSSGGESPTTSADAMSSAEVLPNSTLRPTTPFDTPLQPDSPSTESEVPLDEGTPLQTSTSTGSDSSGEGLGTFTGVFRPTVLTILGMMAYLRMGWAVGEAGLFGAFAIIILIYAITSTTALSLSSITTNIRLGSGGVFAIISRSLGLETGGAIGLPLYLAQALGGAMYIYGFAEAWLFVFPDHNPWWPTIGVFLFISLVTSFSTKLAFQLQGIVIVLVAVSLSSIFLGLIHIGDHVPHLHNPQLFGNYKNASFWEVFSIIFPAGTGIMVGISMSGALKTPRRSVPLGTLAAVAVSFVIYLALLTWYSVVATPQELSTNYLVSVEKSAWQPAVLTGIIASTFTAALSSMAASPRILYALAVHRILPGSRILSKTSSNGNPRNASYFTILFIGIALSLGSLERIAVLITVFNLLTYLSINMVLLIEQSLGMISFRPSLKTPMWVPAVGTILSIFAMVIISPTFALVAIGFIITVYIWLANKKLESPWETVRSSLFVALADWAARRVASGPTEHNERSWKPDFLVPVQSRSQIDGNFRFLRALAYPKGSVQMVGFSRPDVRRRSLSQPQIDAAYRKFDIIDEDPYLCKVADEFRCDDLYATSVTIDATELVPGIAQACAVLNSNYSPPSIIYAVASYFDDDEICELINVSKSREIGLAMLARHPQSGLGRERTINVWIRNQAPDWNLALKMASLDIALLLSYQLWRNWHGHINLVTFVKNDDEYPPAHAFLTQLLEDARLPQSTEVVVKQGNFRELIETVPEADIQIIGIAQTTTRATMDEIVQRTNSSVLFVRSSGRESALA